MHKSDQTVEYSAKRPVIFTFSSSSNNSLEETETQLDLSNVATEYVAKVDSLLEDSLLVNEQEDTKRASLEMLPQVEDAVSLLPTSTGDFFSTPVHSYRTKNVSRERINEDEDGNLFTGVHHARRRPMSYYLIPANSKMNSPNATSPGNSSSNSSLQGADLSWDEYDFHVIPSPIRNAAPDDPLVIEASLVTRRSIGGCKSFGGARQSIGGIDPSKPKKKRISLAPCLKTQKLRPFDDNGSPLSVNSETSISSIGSPGSPIDSRKLDLILN